MKKQLVLTDGSRIAYEENGSGQPVVLIHGFTCNSGFWAKTLQSLGKKYHVYAYDLLGHGETVMADNSAVGEDALADQLHDFLIGLGLDNAVIIAHSLGVLVLLQYVMKYKCAFMKAAVLADMTPAMNPADDWSLIAAEGFGSRTALEEIQTDYAGYMDRFFRAGGFPEGTTEEQIQQMYEAWSAQLVPELILKVLASCQPDYRPALKFLTVPTTYFYANQSYILPHPDEIAQYYADHVVNAPFVANPMNTMLHSFPEDLNDEFVARVDQYIQSI